MVLLAVAVATLAVATVALLLRWLLQKPRDSRTVFHHHFSPAGRMRNAVDAAAVTVLHRSLFVSSAEEVSAQMMDKRLSNKDWQKLLAEAVAGVRGNVGFGGNTHWKQPFSLLARLIGSAPHLSVVGRERLRQSLLHSLKVRLRLELLLRDKRDSLPNIDGKMVFVSGLPRSGATLVHNLLSFDTSMFAAFDFGEMHDPALPQVPDIEVKVRLERLKRAMPQLNRKANLRAGKKEDDSFLMQLSFLYPVLALTVRDATEYREWMLAADLAPFYSELRTLYQVMLLRQWGEGGVGARFVLVKSPFHATFFSALVKEFPDARFVMLHRSPRNCVASFCSVLTTISSYYETSVDVTAVGAAAADGRLVAQYVAEREKGEAEERFCDVPFKMLIVDPVAALRDVYRRFGWAYENIEQRRIYLRDNPAELFGKHMYNMEHYKLDGDILTARFREYSALHPEAEALATPLKKS